MNYVLDEETHINKLITRLRQNIPNKSLKICFPFAHFYVDRYIGCYRVEASFERFGSPKVFIEILEPPKLEITDEMKQKEFLFWKSTLSKKHKQLKDATDCYNFIYGQNISPVASTKAELAKKIKKISLEINRIKFGDLKSKLAESAELPELTKLTVLTESNNLRRKLIQLKYNLKLVQLEDDPDKLKDKLTDILAILSKLQGEFPELQGELSKLTLTVLTNSIDHTVKLVHLAELVKSINLKVNMLEDKLAYVLPDLIKAEVAEAEELKSEELIAALAEAEELKSEELKAALAELESESSKQILSDKRIYKHLPNYNDYESEYFKAAKQKETQGNAKQKETLVEQKGGIKKRKDAKAKTKTKKAKVKTNEGLEGLEGLVTKAKTKTKKAKVKTNEALEGLEGLVTKAKTKTKKTKVKTNEGLEGLEGLVTKAKTKTKKAKVKTNEAVEGLITKAKTKTKKAKVKTNEALKAKTKTKTKNPK